ncbi:MAG: helix-turn-helix transcriptional regulator [Thermoleophilaceae bacterium]
MLPGTLLRDVRTRNRLSQEQLARRARTSQAAISRIESGRVSPTFQTMEALLAVMGEKGIIDARPRDWDLDEDLIRQSLARTPAARLDDAVEFANFVLSSRRGAVGG